MKLNQHQKDYIHKQLESEHELKVCISDILPDRRNVKEEMYKLSKELEIHNYELCKNKVELIKLFKKNNLEDKLYEYFADMIEVSQEYLMKYYGLSESKVNQLEKACLLKPITYKDMGEQVYVKDYLGKYVYSIDGLKYLKEALQEEYQQSYKNSNFKIKFDVLQPEHAYMIQSQMSRIFVVSDFQGVHPYKGKKPTEYYTSFTITPLDTDNIDANVSNYRDEENIRLNNEVAKLKSDIEIANTNIKESDEYLGLLKEVQELRTFKREYNDKLREREYDNKNLKAKLNETKKKHSGGRKPKLTDEQKKEIIKLNKKNKLSNKVISELAKEFMCSENTIRNVLKN